MILNINIKQYIIMYIKNVLEVNIDVAPITPRNYGIN